MTILIILLWLANLCCDTIGQIAFKYAAISSHHRIDFNYWRTLLFNRWLWLGITSYAIGFLLWIAFLSYIPLSQAILLGSANIITIMIFGHILFKEKLTFFRVLGVGLITAGVIIVGIG